MMLVHDDRHTPGRNRPAGRFRPVAHGDGLRPGRRTGPRPAARRGPGGRPRQLRRRCDQRRRTGGRLAAGAPAGDGAAVRGGGLHGTGGRLDDPPTTPARPPVGHGQPGDRRRTPGHARRPCPGPARHEGRGGGGCGGRFHERGGRGRRAADLPVRGQRGVDGTGVRAERAVLRRRRQRVLGGRQRPAGPAHTAMGRRRRRDGRGRGDRARARGADTRTAGPLAGVVLGVGGWSHGPE